MKKIMFIVGFMLILALSTAARFYKLDEKSLWSDEVATLATSRGNQIDPDAFRYRNQVFDPVHPVPARVYVQMATTAHPQQGLAAVGQALRQNVHPPMFFGLMNRWIGWFGLSPGTLRVPAALFGVLSILLMFGFAQALAGWIQETNPLFPTRLFSLLCTAFVGFSAYQVDHAQDARQYTLLLCFALSAVWISLPWLRGKKPGWIRLVLLACILAAGIYTQYFFGLFVGFILLACGCANHRSTLSSWPQWVVLCFLIGILLLPWLPFFQAQLFFLKVAGHYTAGLWKPLQLPEKLWRIGCEFFLPHHALGKLMPAVVILSGLGLLFEQRRQAKDKTVRWGLSAPVVFLLAWFGILLSAQIGLDVIKQSHTATIRRYLFLLSPVCYCLLAYWLCWAYQVNQAGRLRWLTVFLSAAFLSCMLGDTADFLFHRHVSSDEFKQVARWIHQRQQPNDLVLVHQSGAMAVGMAYYFHPDTMLWGIDLPTPASQEMRQLALKAWIDQLPAKQKPNYIFLVFSHAGNSQRQAITQWVQQLDYRLVAEDKFPGVRVTEMAFPACSLKCH